MYTAASMLSSFGCRNLKGWLYQPGVGTCRLAVLLFIFLVVYFTSLGPILFFCIHSVLENACLLNRYFLNLSIENHGIIWNERFILSSIQFIFHPTTRYQFLIISKVRLFSLFTYIIIVQLFLLLSSISLLFHTKQHSICCNNTVTELLVEFVLNLSYLHHFYWVYGFLFN